MLRVKETDDSLNAEITDAKILDEGTILQTGKELMDLLPRSAGKRILVNFRRVQFMSSAMIGKLVLLNKQSKAAEVELKFCSISPNVLEVFKITRLNKVFKIVTDEEKALKDFKGGGGWFG